MVLVSFVLCVALRPLAADFIFIFFFLKDTLNSRYSDIICSQICRNSDEFTVPKNFDEQNDM